MTESSPLRILRLSELREADAALFGWKAVNLGKLIQFGMNVPDGVALGRLSSGCLSEGERQALVRACPEGPWAVRSSGSEEDGTDFSFAGLFDSYLNVEEAESLFQRVIDCFQSAESPRSVQYRKEFGLPPQAIGVVVQKMVAATYSGICFTQAPNNSNLLIVELVAGLGEELVSGRVRPAHFALDRISLEIQHRDDPQGWLSVVGVGRIQDLAKDALLAEQKFGFALDLEWAFSESELYWVQARPMTHVRGREHQRSLLQKEKARILAKSESAGSIWTDFSIGDILQNPSPLVMDGFHEVTLPGAGVEKAYRELGIQYQGGTFQSPPLFDSICGRPYINLTEYVRRLMGELPFKAILKGGNQIGIGLDRGVGVLNLVLSPPRLVWRGMKFVSCFYPKRRRFSDEFKSRFSALEAKAKAERAKDLSSLSDVELWDDYLQLNAKSRNELSLDHLLTDIIAMLTQGTLKVGLKLLYGARADEVELTLTTGLDENFNTETNLGLSDVVEGRRSLESFLDEFGHRGTPDWDVAAPRWRENPAPVLQMMEQLRGSQIRGRQEFEKQRALRMESEGQFQTDLQQNFWFRFGLGKFFLKELRFYQVYSPLREMTQSICFHWVELTRRVILEMAKRTDARDLLFYLTGEELKRFFLVPAERLSLFALGRQRKTDLRWVRSVYLPHMISSNELDRIGNPPPVDPSVCSYSGQIISKGYVTGLARVVRTIEEARDLQKGEILVTQFTDPSWTPLFFIAGGLVLEQGSSFSHGALVAREIGLPSLVNIPEITRSIRTGQRITLDAESGRVLLG